MEEATLARCIDQVKEPTSANAYLSETLYYLANCPHNLKLFIDESRSKYKGKDDDILICMVRGVNLCVSDITFDFQAQLPDTVKITQQNLYKSKLNLLKTYQTCRKSKLNLN